MDELESKIVEILQRGTPLRAVQIAAMLGVERREVNHYLYSSLKHLVVQDSDYRWLLNTNQIGNIQPLPNQLRTPQPQPSKPVRQNNPYELIKRELADASSEEKVKILENVFRQERFTELEDDQINALQLILEQAKHEVNIANIAYKQGKLSFWENNPLAIAVVSIALALSIMFAFIQLKSNSTYQTSPNTPQQNR